MGRAPVHSREHRVYVIGTAGHVDHGKSTLLRALTGMGADRLREEQERGLTIDLGFAWFTLPSGREVSVVDVPGHQRFVKNMLAGAGGMDLALLVVAADEGPRQQTREHLAILDVLDVQRIVVVLSKCDLVDEEWADLVEAEVEDLLAPTRFRDAPVLRAGPASGAGIGALVHVIDAALDEVTEREDRSRPRLPVDRVFSARGFGTVVTGTLVDGGLSVGQEVEFQPGALRGRVRGLQRHGRAVEHLGPGTRAAVNVSGVEHTEVRRGMTLGLPGGLSPVAIVGVQVTSVSSLATTLRRASGVTVLAGTAETEARLRLLDRSALEADQTAWATLRLQTPLPILPGDRLVLRTPDETAAGAMVAVTSPRRRRAVDLIEEFERALHGSVGQRVLTTLQAGPASIDEIAFRLNLNTSEVNSAVEALVDTGEAHRVGNRVHASAWIEQQVTRATEVVRGVLTERRLQSAVPREHLRSRLALDPEALQVILHEAVTRGWLVEQDGRDVTVPGYRVELAPADQVALDRLLRALDERGHASAGEFDVDAALVAFAAGDGLLVAVGGGLLFSPDAYRRLGERLVAHLQVHGTITLPEARDLLGLGRRYAQAYLEYLDGEGVTVRAGDVRRLSERIRVTEFG